MFYTNISVVLNPLYIYQIFIFFAVLAFIFVIFIIFVQPFHFFSSFSIFLCSVCILWGASIAPVQFFLSFGFFSFLITILSFLWFYLYLFVQCLCFVWGFPSTCPAFYFFVLFLVFFNLISFYHLIFLSLSVCAVFVFCVAPPFRLSCRPALPGLLLCWGQ